MPPKTISPRLRPFFIIGLAILIKFSLLIFANANAPAAKIQLDSHLYLNAGKALAQKGIYAIPHKDGTIEPITLRTPGYPLFIAIFHHRLNIPLTGIIIIQIGLTLFSAWITYKTAVLINPRYGFLSAVIVLYDLPTTVASIMILTESLFLVFLTLFMLNLVLYLKEQKLKNLVLSALMLVCATYVRPLTFFLPIVMAFNILMFHLRADIKKGITHALLFTIISYSLFLPWQLRNYRLTGQFSFSTIRNITLDMEGLWGSYARNKDTLAAGTSPAGYYAGVTTSGILNILTYPGTLKYFGSKPLKFWGKVLAYPWMVFWFIGFIAGTFKSWRNPYLMLLLAIIMYFIAVTIWTTLSSALGRFRVPMMPYLAIISAHGWFLITSYFKRQDPAVK